MPATVRDVMTSEALTTTPETPVAEVAQLLLARGLGGLPVVDGTGSLVGMVSDLDLIGKRGATVAQVMSRGVVTVGEEATLEEVIALMGLHGIRRVPVVRDGRPVGIVSRTDLLRHAISTW